MKKRVLIAVTGASGQIYAKAIIERLNSNSDIDLEVVFSKTAIEVWNSELTTSFSEACNPPLKNIQNLKIIDNSDFGNRNASGSNCADVMIIVPCTMGTIGRVAAGTSDSLILRAADVMLKERRKLVLVPRENPYSLIHLKNMTELTQAGAIVAPASPSFYQKPSNINEMVSIFSDRILEIAGISKVDEKYRWGFKED